MVVLKQKTTNKKIKNFYKRILTQLVQHPYKKNMIYFTEPLSFFSNLSL